MANRKSRCEKTDFATKLEELGFMQIGDCTFIKNRIKIFRTNKTNSERVRYWEVQEISTSRVFYKSNHTSEIIEYLSHSQFLTAGAFINVVVSR